MRFLFLPEGHDPDSLVGEEGREAFEARLGRRDAAVGILRARALRAGGPVARRRPRAFRRSRPAAAREGCRPACIASCCWAAWRRRSSLPPQRLEELWNAGAKPRRMRSLAAAGAQPVSASAPASRACSARARQPGAAGDRRCCCAFRRSPRNVSAEERAALDRLSKSRASSCCVNCWTTCAPSPRSLPAQVIERWADRPEQESLVKLLQKEEVITDAAAAAGELRAALAKLARAGRYPAFRGPAGQGAGRPGSPGCELNTLNFKRLMRHRGRPERASALTARWIWQLRELSHRIARFSSAPLELAFRRVLT